MRALPIPVCRLENVRSLQTIVTLEKIEKDERQLISSFIQHVL